MRRLLDHLPLLVGLLALPTLGYADVPGTLAPTLEFQTIDGVQVPFQSGVPLMDFEPQQRETIDMGGTWKKERVSLDHDLSFTKRDAATITAIETEGGGRHTAAYDDSAWDTRTLPGVEAEMPGNESAPPEAYHDGVWYRRTVNVPADWEGGRINFAFLSANYILDLWVNGEWVGVHEGGYTPFAFDISDDLNYGAVNQIAVRVDKPLPGSRQDAVPSWVAMDWWSYTGVIQGLYLVKLPATHIVRTNVVAQDYNGKFAVDTVVANADGGDTDAEVAIEIFHADPDDPDYLTDPDPSKIIGDTAKFDGADSATVSVDGNDVAVARFSPTIRSPRRWTPDEPNLYVLKTTLRIGGNIVDTHHTQLGIRTVERDSGKLLVNGRVAFLPGVARHEEWPDTGRTASWERIRDDIEILREDLNALFFRSGHYPSHMYTYLLTDRLGLATMVEIPVYWFLGWNWDHEEQRRIAQQMFREMVLSNFNRPSVLMWGLNNEPPFLFWEKILAYNERMTADHDDNLSDRRLITQSPAAGAGWEKLAASIAPIDVAGWTLYYGVFYDEYEDVEGFLDTHRETYPDYPIVATEFGLWSNSDDSNSQEQEDAFTNTWPYFASYAALDTEGNVNDDGVLAATSWWCAFNWFTKNGLPEFIGPFAQTMGLIHQDRTTWKPVASVLAEAYQAYADFGGLGPEPDDYVIGDDDDDDAGDDDASDDDTADDDSASDDDIADDDASEDDDDDDAGCGC
ncbi:glycoside hydrolase family 2 [bacterium]|nr:glycoside hydrolase family 2 [bacterium]